jgi:hypothetical protein
VVLALYLHLADGGPLPLDGTSLFLDPELQALGVCPALPRQNKREKKPQSCHMFLGYLPPFVHLRRPMSKS